MKIISLHESEAQEKLDTVQEFLPGGYIDELNIIFDIQAEETSQWEGFGLVIDVNGLSTTYRAFTETDNGLKYVKFPQDEEGFVELFNQSTGSVYILEETSDKDRSTFFIVAV